MSKVFYDKPVIEQIFEEFEKDRDKDILLNLVERLPPEDVNVQDDYGNTVLISASWKGYTEIVKLLLEKEDIDANIQRDYRDTALIGASWEGHTEIVKLLLEKEGIDINIQDDYGQTALICASINNHIEIVKLLENYQKN